MQSVVQNDIKNVFRPVKEQLKQVRSLIEKQVKVSCPDKRVKELATSLSLCSGKMIRPALVLLSGGSCGRITNKHIQVAAVVEMLHNATLLHDDVLDDGFMRRGKKTINRLYGNEPAVLLGDLLLSRVFRMCAGMESRINQILASTTARVCEGELRQTVRKNSWELSEAEYLDIITEKSAVLFSSSCQLGAILAGANARQTRMLGEYGLNFGRAYQIGDDLLDIVGDEKKTGKTVGSDVNKSKPTLALIHLLGRLRGNEKSSLIKNLVSENGDIKAVREMLEERGSIEYVRGRIAQLIRKSIQSISSFKENRSKKALVKIAEFAGAIAG